MLVGITPGRPNGTSWQRRSRFRARAVLGLAVAAVGWSSPAIAATGQWNVDAGGAWSTASNWLAGTIPNAIDDVASLDAINLTADATVTLDVGVTLGQVTFGDADTSSAAGWILAGPSSLTLSTSTGAPTVTVNPLGTGEVTEISAVVAGTQGLSKAGVGTLVLTGANTYSGGTTISGGTLQVGTGQAAAADLATLGGAGAIVNNGTLDIFKTNALVIGDNISGSGNVIKRGTGPLTLNGTNTYTGATQVDNGLITFGTAASVSGLTANSVTVNAAGAVSYGAASVLDATFLGKINTASIGALAITGTDAATNFDFTAGPLSSYTGMSVGVAAGNTVSYTGTITPAASTYRLGGGGGTLVMPNVISSASNVVIGNTNGSGTVAFTAANTYSGTTTINAGNTLNIGNGGATGTVGTGAITNNGTIDFSRTDNQTFAGTMTGTGVFQKRNTGAVVATNMSITGSINLSGNLFINRNVTTGAAVDTVSVDGGTLIATGTGSVIQGGTGPGQLILNSGTLTLGTLNTDNNDGALIRVNGGTFTAADLGLARIGGTTTPTYGNGFVVAGGTATVGILRVGRTGANSWGIASFEGGTSTITGAMTIGQTTNGGRGGAVRVQGTAVLNSTDTVDGIVMGRTNGTTNQQTSQLTFSGGIATVEKFKMGFDNTLLTGSATTNVTGTGLLYVGSGGMEKNSAVGHVANVNFSGGTIGAKANWSAAAPIGWNVTGTTATFKAADASDNPFDLTINGIVSGAGTINKTGGGVLGLLGANTYTGPTNVTAGVLAGKGSSLRGNIANSATVRFNEPSGASTFAGVISGTGAVEKTGVGTTVLNAGQTYSGATSIGGGVLRFVGAHTTTSGVTVNNGGGIGAGTGASISALTLNGGVTLSSNDGTGIKTLTVANNNGLVANGLTTVDLGTAGVASGSFTLIDYSGTIGGGGFSPSTFTLGALPPRTLANLVHNVPNTSIDVNVSSDVPRWNGTIDGEWNTATQNWKTLTSNANTAYIEGDQVLFNDSATGTTTVNLAGIVNPSLVTANNSALAYTIGGSGSISGATSLIKQGTGTLNLNTANTFTGGTTLQAGTLVLGNPNALPAAGNITITGGTFDAGFQNPTYTGNLTLDGGTITNGGINKTSGSFELKSGTVNSTASLSGAAGVNKSGPGTVVFLGNGHLYTGQATVLEGTLQLGNGANDGNVPGNITNSGTIAFDQASDGFVWSNQIVGTGGTVIKNNSLNLTFVNVNEGNTIINAGTLTVVGPGGTSVLPRVGRGGTLTVNNGATVLATGADALGLNTANLPPNFTLNTGGAIRAAADATLTIYNGTFAGGILGGDLGYAFLTLRGDYTTTDGSSSTIDTGGGALGLFNAVTFALGTGSMMTINANMSGATSLAGTGAGTMVLNGDNTTVTGGLSAIGGAVLVINNANNLGDAAGAVTMNTGTIRTTAAVSIPNQIRTTGGATFDTNGFDSTITGAVTEGNSLTKTGAGTLTLAGANTYTGATNVNAGKLLLAQSATTSGSVNVTGGTLELADGGGSNRVISTGAVAVTGTGKIDIKDNKLITTSPAGSATAGVYDGVQRLVQTAYTGGTWTGPGLTTSLPAATTGLTSIGVINAGLKFNIGPTATATFAGQTVTGASTLAMYTYGGDANLDGFISGDDYTAIDFAIATPGSSGWANGDFNYDGIISGDDYTVIDFNIVAQGAPFPTSGSAALSGVTAVPEPGSLSVIGLAAGSALGRRRRRREN